MRPRPGEGCHDYACGSAGLLVKLQLVSRDLDPTSRVPLKLCGQELQAESYAVAHMNAIIHDMEVEIARGDTMINPKFKTASGQINTHDVVVANPDVEPTVRSRPLRQRPVRPLPHTWRHHHRQGRLGMASTHARLSERTRTRRSGARHRRRDTRLRSSKHEDKERNIRKWFVDRDLIDGRHPAA